MVAVVFDVNALATWRNGAFVAYDQLIAFVRNARKAGKVQQVGRFAQCATSPKWQDAVRPEFFRPGLRDAFASIKKAFPGAKFYSYCDSAFGRACIRLIEKHAGVPVKALVYKESVDVAGKTQIKSPLRVPAGQLLHVDDVWRSWGDPDARVESPRYMYDQPVKIDDGILRLVWGDPLVREYTSHLARMGIPRPADGSTYDQYLAAYFAHHADAYDAAGEETDTFMPRLAAAMKRHAGKAQPFSTANVAAIVKALAKEVKPAKK